MYVFSNHWNALAINLACWQKHILSFNCHLTKMLCSLRWQRVTPVIRYPDDLEWTVSFWLRCHKNEVPQEVRANPELHSQSTGLQNLQWTEHQVAHQGELLSVNICYRSPQHYMEVFKPFAQIFLSAGHCLQTPALHRRPAVRSHHLSPASKRSLCWKTNSRVRKVVWRTSSHLSEDLGIVENERLWPTLRGATEVHDEDDYHFSTCITMPPSGGVIGECNLWYRTMLWLFVVFLFFICYYFHDTAYCYFFYKKDNFSMLCV